MRFRALFSCVLVLTALAASATAQADDPDQPNAADIATARELFREAARLGQEGKWQEAMEKFRRSMLLRPSTLTRYSLAVAQERCGLLIEALENLRVFLQSASDADAQQYVGPAKTLIDGIEPRIARLTVNVPKQSSADAYLDGSKLSDAAIGIPRLINPGPHKLEARRNGKVVSTKEVSLDEGQSMEVMLEVLAPTVAQRPVAPPAQKPEEKKSGSPLGLVLTIGGGTIFVGGLALGIVGWNKAKDSPTSDGDEADKAKTFALVGDIMMGSGLVLGGVGTYLMVSSGSAEPTQAISPWATPHGAGVAYSGSWK